MKKISIVYILLLCILSGCGNQEYINDYKANEEILSGSGYKQTETAKEKVSDDEYNYMMNNNSYITANESGLYYIALNRERIVRYYDYSGKMENVWCNKLDCKHNTSRCAAYILYQNESKYFLQYHKDKLYLMNYKDDGIYLERYDMDGSNEIRIGNLYPDDITVANVYNGRFYKDKYYYFVTDTARNRHFYMIDLMQGSKAVKLFESKDWGARKLSTYFCVNDNGILYREGKSANEITTLKQYDIKSNQSKVILESDDQFEAECNDDIYVLKDGGVYRIENGELVVVFEDEDIQYNNCYMYINGKYIVIDHRNDDGTNNAYEGQRYFYVYSIADKTMKKLDMASDCMVYNKANEKEEAKAVPSLSVIGLCNDNFYYMQSSDLKVRRVNLVSFTSGNEEREYEETITLNMGINQ